MYCSEPEVEPCAPLLDSTTSGSACINPIGNGNLLPLSAKRLQLTGADRSMKSIMRNRKKNLWGIVKRKMSNIRPNNRDELKAAIEASWASVTPQQCHRLIDSCKRRHDQVLRALI